MWRKMTGGESILPVPDKIAIFRGFTGGFLGILVLLLITQWSGTMFIIAPFGASCVLMFAAPKTPLAQPRNVICGHLLTTFLGISMLNLFGNGVISIAVAVGLSIALMQILRVAHAPAGANPIMVMMLGITSYSFLLVPVLAGAILLVIVALIVNNIGEKSRWPCYWIGHPLRIKRKKHIHAKN